MFDADPREGGMTVAAWMALWSQCHVASGMGGATRTAWPDGGSLLDQPAILVAMFGLVGDELEVVAERRRALRNG